MEHERGPFFSNPLVARAGRWGLVAWSVIGILIVAWGAYTYVLHPIRIVFPPLVVALILVYLVNPVVERLVRRGIPRLLAAVLSYIVILGAIGAWLSYLIPVVSHQVAQFVAGVPALLATAQHGIDSFAARLGVRVNAADLVSSFQPSGGEAFRFLGRLTSFTSGVVRLVLDLVLGPLIAFYLLVDLPKIRRSVTALVPMRRRGELLGLGARVGDTLGGFFRGQLLVALIVGHVAALGFWLAGLPYFAVLGLAAGLLALVPMIGIVIVAVPVLFVAATAAPAAGAPLHLGAGWALVGPAALVLVLVQQLDTRLLTPRFQAPAVRLHPITVLLSLLIGGTLLGLWGMLLAVPTVAAGKVVVLHIWDTRSQWPPRTVGPTAVEGDGVAGRDRRRAAGGSA